MIITRLSNVMMVWEVPKCVEISRIPSKKHKIIIFVIYANRKWLEVCVT